MNDESAPGEVADWRRRIDEIDLQLVRLVNARSACANEIGRLKRRLGLAIYDPAREGEILQRVSEASPGPLDPGGLFQLPAHAPEVDGQEIGVMAYAGHGDDLIGPVFHTAGDGNFFHHEVG